MDRGPERHFQAASSVRVTEAPPAHWQHGRKYCVYVHLDEIHDYTRATVDHIGAITPAKRRLPPWQLGVADGAKVPRRQAPLRDPFSSSATQGGAQTGTFTT